jgi:hypothetical protein
MPSGRPHQPNDPSVLASVEAALSSVARPSLVTRMWHWRYELGLITGVILGAVFIGVTLGPGWLIAATAAAMASLAIGLAWPSSRRRLIARAWCVITPHRVRTGCTHAWVQTRDGRLPTVLYTVPAEFGERVWLWCRAGITSRDLAAAREILRAACWASDVRVVVNDRRSHIVVLEVIRRRPPERPEDDQSGWPYLDPDRGEADRAEPGEPASYHGLGLPPSVRLKGTAGTPPVSRPASPARPRPLPRCRHRPGLGRRRL